MILVFTALSLLSVTQAQTPALIQDPVLEAYRVCVGALSNASVFSQDLGIVVLNRPNPTQSKALDGVYSFTPAGLVYWHSCPRTETDTLLKYKVGPKQVGYEYPAGKFLAIHNSATPPHASNWGIPNGASAAPTTQCEGTRVIDAKVRAVITAEIDLKISRFGNQVSEVKDQARSEIDRMRRAHPVVDPEADPHVLTAKTQLLSAEEVAEKLLDIYSTRRVPLQACEAALDAVPKASSTPDFVTVHTNVTRKLKAIDDAAKVANKVLHPELVQPPALPPGISETGAPIYHAPTAPTAH